MYNSDYKKEGDAPVIGFVCTLLLWNCGRCEISRRCYEVNVEGGLPGPKQKEKRSETKQKEETTRARLQSSAKPILTYKICSPEQLS